MSSDSNSGGVMAPIRRATVESVDVSQQIQQRLKRADDLEVAVEKLQGLLDDSHRETADLKRELQALRPLANKADEIAARSRELDAREKGLDAREELTKFQLAAQEDRVNDHIRMVELIFRNTEVRRSRMVPVAVDGGDMPTGQYGANGETLMQRAPGLVSHENETESETKE